MIIYLVMIDFDGMMRSTCDTVEAAFKTNEAAEEFIKNNTKGTNICGGYRAKILTTELVD